MTVFGVVIVQEPVYVAMVLAGALGPVLSTPGKQPPIPSEPSGAFAGPVQEPVGAGLGDGAGAGCGDGDGDGDGEGEVAAVIVSLWLAVIRPSKLAEMLTEPVADALK
jgi:hypothetical protein